MGRNATVPRLKFLLRTSPSKSEVRSVDPETEVSFVPMEAVGEYGGLDLERTRPLAEVMDGYTYFRNGDVVVAKITPCFENGKRALATDLSGGIGFGTTELHVLRALDELNSRYLFYLTLSHRFQKLGESTMYGAGGQKRVPDDFIREYRHELPPLPTQCSIAAFLDGETAKIDTLIERKRQLLDLLEEKRTAVINRAVTCGLDPCTRMTSTTSWAFPEIPMHWRLWKLRRLVTQVKRPLHVDPEDEYQEIGLRSWGKGIFHKDPTRGSVLGDKRVFHIAPGDLVLNIVFAWEGAVALVSESEVGMIASHRFPTFRVSSATNPDYLLMLFQSDHGRALLEINSPGAAGRNRTLRVSQLMGEEIPLPSIEVQNKVVSRFRMEEERLLALETRLHHAITLLQEYRTALISAAVTGQIDVEATAA